MEIPMDVKKVAVIAIVVFLGYWMFNDPGGLAAIAKTTGDQGWDLTTQLFRGIIDFVTSF